MADPVALQGFVDKWLAREPEMAVCERFCPKPQRQLFRAWGALSGELADCMFEIEDTHVARTKLAWWADDLTAGLDGRHPLTKALFAHGAAERTQSSQWRALGAAAMRLVDSDHVPDSLEVALSELVPFAAAVSELEAELFEVVTSARSQAVHVQLERSLRGALGVWPERARIPAALRNAAEAADLRCYAAALLAHDCHVPQGSLISIFRCLVGRHRLRRLQTTGDPVIATSLTGWRGVLLAWRSARLSLRSRKGSTASD